MSTSPLPAPEEPVELALVAPLRVRLLGVGLVLVALVVLLGVLVSSLAGLPEVVVTVLVLLAGLAVVALALLLGVRRWVVRLDEHGYRVRGIRTAQVRSARWSDVLDLQASNREGARCVTLRLRDGRTTTLPVDAVEGGPAHLTALLTARLDREHGYRRLR